MIVEKILEAIDFAYLAGLLDGEGSIVIYKRPLRRGDITPRYEVTISLGITDRRIVYWLKDCFGGSAFEIKAVQGNRRRIWGWRLHGRACSDLLKRIVPYLKIKGLQAAIAIHFQDNMLNKSRHRGQAIGDSELILRERLYETNKILNQGYDPEAEGGYGDS